MGNANLSGIIRRPGGEEQIMDFEYTDTEYLVECTEGCGEITGWLQSRLIAEQVIHNHSKENAHKCQIKERTRPDGLDHVSPNENKT